ncbi:MAG TPA: 2-hydroxychromene-2-carboxylate isomerase, partial [Alphaproteobacteria bacterium]|nr:2-hydroxychromene-2-carboxylate isomerase [Alphaproteobacteria bacterium]
MPTIEYFYAAHSAYAYLGSAKLMEIAAESGAEIIHRPMDLRRVVPAAGSIPTSERTAAHRAYFFGREIQRWSEERGAPVVKGTPTHHYNDIALPNCFLIAAMEAGHNIDRLAHALLEAHWRDDADLANPPTLARLAAGLGLDGESLLAAAETPATTGLYERYTQEAIDRSVFGSPTYFVDGDMFYGQDR